jgi:hypothetical protein
VLLLYNMSAVARLSILIWEELMFHGEIIGESGSDITEHRVERRHVTVKRFYAH